MSDIDIPSFKTHNILNDKSEWEKTIGSDKNHLYFGSNIMTIQDAEMLWMHPSHALYKQYFDQNK